MDELSIADIYALIQYIENRRQIELETKNSKIEDIKTRSHQRNRELLNILDKLDRELILRTEKLFGESLRYNYLAEKP